MEKNKFKLIADTLRQYRRAELKDFGPGNEDVLENLYTDPLPDNAVLQTILSPNTTFIIGRKGTGKSTVFAMAQRVIRKEGHHISAYIDVKTMYESTKQNVVMKKVSKSGIDERALQIHLIRKSFIAEILKELISEVRVMSSSLNLIQRWTGQRKKYAILMENLEEIENSLSDSSLKNHELPILETITQKQRLNEKDNLRRGKKIGAKMSDSSASISAEISRIDEALTDEELYREYTDVLLRSFPFNDLIREITNLLNNVDLGKLYVFFDDFSEINWIDQRLFVDVVLSPLNNTSNEKIKLKIAAYPGRVYYGKIDPTKIDELSLDFFSLYRNPKLPEIENAAILYTKRLVERRFSYYKTNFDDYVDPKENKNELYYLLFAVSMNIPRVLGYIFYYCYLDRIAHGRLITRQALINASQKYYEEKLLSYFKLNRYALEPYDRKLDRHNQKILLDSIIEKSKEVRKKIITGNVSGELFLDLKNPPTSHFTISPDLEKILSSLEFNIFVSKYHHMRDKDGKDISVFALYYGLCAGERMEWGYPKRKRYDKDYFKQRIFNFNTTFHEFLTTTQTIKCGKCGAAFPMEQSDKFEFYKWRCPECQDGICKIIKLDDTFKRELIKLNEDVMLEPVEFGIIQTLNDENQPMKAKEISALLDVKYQLVGKRTEKLQDMGLIEKKSIGSQKYNFLTNHAHNIYFDQ